MNQNEKNNNEESYSNVNIFVINLEIFFLLIFRNESII